LGLFDFLTLGVLVRNLPTHAVLTATVIAAKLLIGIQAADQQSADFAGLKSLAPFELTVDPGSSAAKLPAIESFADVSEGVMADGISIAHPSLPLRQLGFGFQLQKTIKLISMKPVMQCMKMTRRRLEKNLLKTY